MRNAGGSGSEDASRSLVIPERLPGTEEGLWFDHTQEAAPGELRGRLLSHGWVLGLPGDVYADVIHGALEHVVEGDAVLAPTRISLGLEIEPAAPVLA